MSAYDVPLVRVPWSPDLDMRRVMVANALACVGMHGGTADSVAAFQRLLGPSTTGAYGIWPLAKPYTGRGTDGISTCAMVALGLLRRAGVANVDIRDGYHDDMGSGLNVAIAFAKSLHPRSAWYTPRPDGALRPALGDIVQVVGGNGIHVLTVVAWDTEADGTTTLVSVDGGQVGADGLQMIARCRRPWRDDARGAMLGARRVDGWIDVTMLPYAGDVTLPEVAVATATKG